MYNWYNFMVFKFYYCLFCYVFRAAGTIIGRGLTSFITDWDKVSAAVSPFVHVQLNDHYQYNSFTAC